MALPERKYYPLTKVAEIVKCDIEDLLHFSAMGLLQICGHSINKTKNNNKIGYKNNSKTHNLQIEFIRSLLLIKYGNE